MKHDLEPINRTMLFSSGVRASRTALQWERDPTPDELDSDDYTVQRCDGSVGWWMGDIVCKRIDLKLRADAARDNATNKPVFLTPEDRHGFLREFAREYAASRNLAEATVLDRTRVAAFFAPPTRHVELGWGHHAEVYHAVSGQGIDLATEWLRRAHDGQWSVAKLRAELRMFTAAPSQQDAGNATGAPPAEVVDVERWAAHEWPALKKAKHEHAAWLLSQMPMTVRAIDHLRSIVVASAGEG